MDLRMLSNSKGLPAQLVMTYKSGSAFEGNTSVKEGDSGGALVCRAYKLIVLILDTIAPHVCQIHMHHALVRESRAQRLRPQE